MNIKIAHLYYDLMNLYGESGNIKVLDYYLRSQGIKVTIDKLSIDDKIDFTKYDLFYIGSGTENNQKIVLNDLFKYKKDIQKALKVNKFFLITGNALEMFGKSIDDISCLDIFNFETTYSEKRKASESIFHFGELNLDLLGFQNQFGSMKFLDEPLFEVKQGIGSGNTESSHEGVRVNNFYGTYLLGPILARNPEFTVYFVSKLINSINKDFSFKGFNIKLDNDAYNKYMSVKYAKNE